MNAPMTQLQLLLSPLPVRRAHPSLSTLPCLATSSLPSAGRLSVKMSRIGTRYSTDILTTPPPNWQQHIAPGRWAGQARPAVQQH